MLPLVGFQCQTRVLSYSRIHRNGLAMCFIKQLSWLSKELLISVALLLWVASSEIMSSNMRERAFISSCACAKSRADPCSPFLHSVVSNDSVSGQGKPWSDCADAQADMGLRCPHMPEDKFPHGAAHAARPMPRNVRKRQFWHVGQTKTQISLRIRAVWSELRCSYEET